VPGPLVALHAEEEFADAEVLPNLYCSTNRDALDRLVRETEVRLKLCSGNAGWASGQLESELEAGGWLSTRATIDEVFAEYDSIWKSVTQRIGLEIMAPDIDSEHMPTDPSLN
jgi:putative transcriptional regulator